MRVTVKYVYPEKGTRNGRVYSQEVLEKAFNEPAFKELCLAKALPIKDEADELIGMGTARLEDDRAVIIDAEVFSPAHINALKIADHSMGFTLAGYGNVVQDNGVNIVTDFTIDSAMLCEHTAVDCSMEIQQED
jgi:hypothetical protein